SMFRRTLQSLFNNNPEDNPNNNNSSKDKYNQLRTQVLEELVQRRLQETQARLASFDFASTTIPPPDITSTQETFPDVGNNEEEESNTTYNFPEELQQVTERSEDLTPHSTTRLLTSLNTLSTCLQSQNNNNTGANLPITISSFHGRPNENIRYAGMGFKEAAQAWLMNKLTANADIGQWANWNAFKADESNNPESNNNIELNHVSHRERLIRIKGKINGHPAQILINSGVTKNFIDRDFAYKNQLQINNDKKIAVELANGNKESIEQTVTMSARNNESNSVNTIYISRQQLANSNKNKELFAIFVSEEVNTVQ
ncbi:17780_t:CDS:2, partial [Dentiscutata erythropus]